MLSGLTRQQHDSLQRMIAADVTIAMSALHLLGVVALNRGTDRNPDQDSAELTDLGRYAIRLCAEWHRLAIRCSRCE